MSKSPLLGTKTLLMGDVGTGKTHALRTLVDAGLQPLCIFTENGYKVLGPALADKISWIFVSPVTGDWNAIRKQAESIRTKDQSALAKEYDASRKNESPFDRILGAMFKFVDQNGRDWGNIAQWTTKHAFVLDSLSGVQRAAWWDVAGNRVLVDKPDYGIIQRLLDNLISRLWAERCHVVMTAHIEKEIDPIKGGMLISPSLPGKAMMASVGRDFDEILLTERTNSKFTWTNIDPGAKLKARNLPWASGMEPSFVPIIEGWKRNGGIIE